MASAFRRLVGLRCLKASEKTLSLQLKQIIPKMRLQTAEADFNPLKISLPLNSLPELNSHSHVSSFIHDFEVDELVPSVEQDTGGANLVFSVDRGKFFELELLSQLNYENVNQKWIYDELFPNNQEQNILVEFRYLHVYQSGQQNNKLD